MTPQRQPIARAIHGQGYVPTSVSVVRMVVEEFHRPANRKSVRRARQEESVSTKSGNGQFRAVHTPEPNGDEGRMFINSPSTYRTNRSNVKRKPGARRSSARKRLR